MKATACGLDLSLAATGAAWPDGHVTTIETRPGVPVVERWRHIRSSILTRLAMFVDWYPVVVIEDLVLHTPAATDLGMLHGVIRVALDDLVLAGEIAGVVLIPPASLKKYATGRGNATKADMRVELFKRGTVDLRDDNAVDAWWLRHMALDRYANPVLKMPDSHRAALTAVAWPALDLDQPQEALHGT